MGRVRAVAGPRGPIVKSNLERLEGLKSKGTSIISKNRAANACENEFSNFISRK